MTHKVDHFVHKIMITGVYNLQFFAIEKLFFKANVQLFLRVCQLNRALVNLKTI